MNGGLITAASDRPKRNRRTRYPAAAALAAAVLAGLLLWGCRDARTDDPPPPPAATTPAGIAPDDAPEDEMEASETTKAAAPAGADPDDAPAGAGGEPPPGSYVERGGYAVGLRKVYFHDPDRPFDGWNAVHASDGYRAV